jgi:LysM domain-containing protein
MANLTRHLISISPELRSGPSPGRRLLAVALCGALVLGATFPGLAVAGEADSEGEGTGTTIEVPVGPPDFDPGGEETDLEEEAPAEGEEEGVAAEAEVEAEAPAPEIVTGTAPEAAVEATPPVALPEPPAYAPEPEPARQEEAQSPEPAPVEGQAIVAPQEKRVESSGAAESGASDEAAPPAEPTPQQQAPPASPRPVASTPADSGRRLARKDTYVVQPGDCLWQIAADLLGPGADTQAIEDEVGRLWRLNEDRIGTGDPNLVYVGTELRLR